jgi:HEAT repeat protein
MTSKNRKAKTGSIESNRAVRALAKEHAAVAIQKLVDLLEDPNSCVALSAAGSLLDRGFGKVPHIHRRKLPADKDANQGVKVSIRRFKSKGARDA